jgi:hypothetical protein
MPQLSQKKKQVANILLNKQLVPSKQRFIMTSNPYKTLNFFYDVNSFNDF